MVHCVAYGCNNKSENRKGKQKNIHFFSFPKDESLRKIWIKRLRREGYCWKYSHKLCSDHFDKTQLKVDPERMETYGYPSAQARLKPDAVPSFNYSINFERGKAKGRKRIKLQVWKCFTH